jgi:ribosomal protein S18 acetylase RimI-like enzyme
MIEFRKISLPEESETVQQIDGRIFADSPGDLFDAEDWANFESYWMLEDGAIVGCAAFIHHVDYDETPRPGYLHIVSTGVLPEVRGRGLGRKQKEWQIEYAQALGFEVIVTNVRRSNARMIHLNRQFGFEVRQIHSDFYEDPKEDAIVMERRVANRSLSFSGRLVPD